MKYRSEIDGLRAVAVVPVILYHAGYSWFSGGFVGVDVFFVLSGYLITSIIMADISTQNFSILEFYERRARRILPALFAMILVCFGFAWWLLLPEDMRGFSKSLTSIATISSNVLFWRESNYFDSASEIKPLLHTWSLSVEEQYYVIFPVFILLAWRVGNRRLLWIISIVALLSLAAAQWASIAQPTAAFFLLPTRAWEILLGAIVAFYLFENSDQRGSETLSLLGLLFIAYAIFAFDSSTPVPGIYAVVPTAGAALIIIFAAEGTLVHRILSLKVFVGLGLISYSAYLWHQPIFAIARLNYPQSKLTALALCVSTVLVAIVSWRFVERPFRNRQVVPAKFIYYGSGCGFVILLLIGLTGVRTDGFASRFSVPDYVKNGEFQLARIDNGWCFYSVDSIKTLELGGAGHKCLVGDVESPRRGLLFGDSFAGQYEPFWNSVGKEARLSVTSVTTNWCYPSMTENFTGPETSRAFTQCLYNREWLRKDIDRYQFVVLGGHWGDISRKGKLEEVVDLISGLAENSNMSIFVMASPAIVERRAVMANIYRGDDVPHWAGDADASAANERLRIVSEGLSNVMFLDRSALFGRQNGEDRLLTDDSYPYSLDGRHISIYGSKKSAENFKKSLQYPKFLELVRRF